MSDRILRWLQGALLNGALSITAYRLNRVSRRLEIQRKALISRIRAATGAGNSLNEPAE